jgi:RNA polymerase sigma-70 factor (sigma-E family)
MAVTQPTAVDDAEPAPRDFADFYREAWPGAVRLAALINQDARAAEDLAQEAFTRVYAKWSQVENADAYLRTAIVNACRNSWERKKTERTKLPLLDASRATTTEIEIDGLGDLVATLPYRQRAVLVLRYHAGMSEAEIAGALGCRAGTVKSLASRALASLKKGIEQ